MTMRLNDMKPGARRPQDAPARRTRRFRRPGQDLRPWREGPARAQGRLPQGRLRRRPDAAAAPPAEGRLPLEDRSDAAEVRLRRARQGRGRELIDLDALKKANIIPTFAERAKVVAVGRDQEGRHAQGHRRHQGRARGHREGRRHGRGWKPKASLKAKKSGQDMATVAGNPAARARRRGALRRRAPSPAVPARRARSSIASARTFPCRASTPSAWRASSSDKPSTIFGIVNMFSGGALERLSIFAMGVMPYISASIIVQMMAMVVPQSMAVSQGRRVRPAQDHARSRATARWCSRCSSRSPRPVALQTQGMVVDPGSAASCSSAAHHHDHRRHVPDVARRADHRARHRQRHLDDHPGAASSPACRARSAARSSRSTPAR